MAGCGKGRGYWYFAVGGLQVKEGWTLSGPRLSPLQVGLHEPVPWAEQAKQHGTSIEVSVHPLKLAEVSALTQELRVDMYTVRECQPSYDKRCAVPHQADGACPPQDLVELYTVRRITHAPTLILTIRAVRAPVTTPSSIEDYDQVLGKSQGGSGGRKKR
jgi:hypothetical protein